MRLSLHMAVVTGVTLWLALAAGARSLPRAKQPRATRGFKNTEMMTARGFGKRMNLEPLQSMTMGPTDNFLDVLEAPQERGFVERAGMELEDKMPENVPVEWFVDELLNNPELTRTVVRKFIDINQDGVLTPDELLRNVY